MYAFESRIHIINDLWEATVCYSEISVAVQHELLHWWYTCSGMFICMRTNKQMERSPFEVLTLSLTVQFAMYLTLFIVT